MTARVAIGTIAAWLNKSARCLNDRRRCGIATLPIDDQLLSCIWGFPLIGRLHKHDLALYRYVQVEQTKQIVLQAYIIMEIRACFHKIFDVRLLRVESHSQRPQIGHQRTVLLDPRYQEIETVTMAWPHREAIAAKAQSQNVCFQSHFPGNLTSVKRYEMIS